MDDTSELVAQLCTRAGMIMEDVSPIALTMTTLEDRERELALEGLAQEISRMQLLVQAALALNGSNEL